MKELDIEKRRTDSLLYQMIPRSVADRLRQGEPALNTCEVCTVCDGNHSCQVVRLDNIFV